MGGFVTKGFGPSIIAALVGAAVAVGTMAVTGNTTLGDSSADLVTINGSLTQTGSGNTTRYTLKNTGTGGREWFLDANATAGGAPDALSIWDNTAGAYRVVISSAGSVDIGGNVTLGDANADLAKAWGHGSVNGTAPSVSTCGTSPSITGTDVAMRLTSGSTAGGACTVTFSRTWTTAPVCTVTAQTGTGTNPSPSYSNSATAITFTAISNSANYNIHCICTGSSCT